MKMIPLFRHKKQKENDMKKIILADFEGNEQHNNIKFIQLDEVMSGVIILTIYPDERGFCYS